jgi:hypothetical protein
MVFKKHNVRFIDPATNPKVNSSSTQLDEKVGWEIDFSKAPTRDIVKGDKVYFAGGTTVPRFKVRDYFEKIGATIVRKYENATIIVYSDNFNEIHFNTSPYSSYRINVNQAKISVILQEAKRLIAGGHYVNSDFIDFLTISDPNLEVLGHSYTLLYTGNRSNLLYAKDDCYNFIDHLYNNPALPYINSTQITKNLSSQVFDEEAKTNILKMLASKEQSNVQVAMEVMANSDYNSNFEFLTSACLTYRINILNSSTHNSVNFKALLEYLFFQKTIPYRLTIDESIQNSIKRGAFTTEKLLELKKSLVRVLHGKLEIETQYFKIKSIELEVVEPGKN